MIDTYFFDTYAIVEIIRGNENYKAYIKKNAILTQLNIFELFYGLIKDFDVEFANKIIDKYYISVVGYGKGIIKEAVLFKLENKKKNLSMTDCVGYVMAKKMNIKFLTGDKEFKDLENVEFIK